MGKRGGITCNKSPETESYWSCCGYGGNDCKAQGHHVALLGRFLDKTDVHINKQTKHPCSIKLCALKMVGCQRKQRDQRFQFLSLGRPKLNVFLILLRLIVKMQNVLGS